MAANIIKKIFLFILKNLWVILLGIAIFWFARKTAPKPEPPDPIIKIKTVYVFDSVLADTLRASRDKWYQKFFLTKGLYDALLAKWINLKPDTVLVGPEEIVHLKWNYIIRVDRLKDGLDIYCFHIDSLVKAKSLVDYFDNLDSVTLTQAFADMVNHLDSMSVSSDSQMVYGYINKYPVKCKYDEFQIFSTSGTPKIIGKRDLLKGVKYNLYGKMLAQIYPEKHFIGFLGMEIGSRTILLGPYLNTDLEAGIGLQINFIKKGD